MSQPAWAGGPSFLTLLALLLTGCADSRTETFRSPPDSANIASAEFAVPLAGSTGWKVVYLAPNASAWRQVGQTYELSIRSSGPEEAEYVSLILESSQTQLRHIALMPGLRWATTLVSDTPAGIGLIIVYAAGADTTPSRASLTLGEGTGIGPTLSGLEFGSGAAVGLYHDRLGESRSIGFDVHDERPRLAGAYGPGLLQITWENRTQDESLHAMGGWLDVRGARPGSLDFAVDLDGDTRGGRAVIVQPATGQVTLLDNGVGYHQSGELQLELRSVEIAPTIRLQQLHVPWNTTSSGFVIDREALFFAGIGEDP